jgi:hypothetical protein
VRERAVAFTVSGQRERYLRRTLESWRRARGVQDWSFVFSLEPCEQVFPIAAFRDWAVASFPDVTVLVNRTRQGCARNTRQAMGYCFSEGAGFAVLAEEDIEVSADVLEYFSWAAGKYEGAGLATVCSHVKASDGGRPDQVTRASWFSPLVWGTWWRTWQEFVAPTWGGCFTNREAWDTNLRAEIQAAGMDSLFPVLSRSLHFGEVSTLTTTGLAAHLYELSRSECFTAEHGPSAWTEVEFDSIPSMLV